MNHDRSTLDRKKHIEKLKEGLTGSLPKHFEKLVPAQTWTVYWITHSLNLLEQNLYLNDLNENVIQFISECAHKDGGYGGGPGQIAHLATTFAAVNSLITVATEEALDSIDRINLIKFLHRMKQPDGSFTMHEDGEIDSRATYCALAVLRCLNIEDSPLLKNVADWILSCQTYEGGFGSVPGSEAHGGYTFCCVASLCLLNQLHRVDMGSLLRWLTNKQMSEDGGFCGRSNKLVDSCYSYWQGAVLPLLHPFLENLINLDETKAKKEKSFIQRNRDKASQNNVDGPATRSKTATANPPTDQKLEDEGIKVEQEQKELLNEWIFDCDALQDYVLNQCQAKGGLLKDKPSTAPDFYHTCYALSGLSISQHQPNGDVFDSGNKSINLLTTTHHLFNVTLSNLNSCFYHFKNKKIEMFEESE